MCHPGSTCQGFLSSKAGENRLGALRQHVERGRGQVPSQQLAQLTSWLKEQEEELVALRAHCQGRWDQLDSTLSTLNRLGF